MTMALMETRDVLLGDMVARFRCDKAANTVGLELLPTTMREQTATRRELLTAPEVARLAALWGPFRAWNVEPLAHLKIVGDEAPGGFAQGRTMRGTSRLACAGHNVREEAGGVCVETLLKHPSGLEVLHQLNWRTGDLFVTNRSSVVNRGSAPVTLEMITSFSLGGLTPFDGGDAPDRLWLHRFRSGWSSEGRHEAAPCEALGLDRSWTGHAAFSERFGQVGTMPVRGFFPRVLAEDRTAGVFWGAQLCWAGSWQMEMYRKDDCLCLSGGLADREFGHWLKVLKPGESLDTPLAVLSVVRGDLEDICHRLNACMEEAARRQPAAEEDLPPVFNDWSMVWGRPTQTTVEAALRRLRGSPIRYFVIDAGWYARPKGSWEACQGDWVPSDTSFPHGLRAAADAIRQAGLTPGLWFEYEVAGADSAAFSLTDHLLKRDGIPITVTGRRFWDFRDPWVVNHLKERVLGLLRSCGFGYLKIDYNETIGIGCDGAESLGEGLRQQVEAVYRWMDLLRAEMPELVIENCSSGGHRHEPSMVGRCAMTSFSDAHETVGIPIIAANLQRLLLPRQTQIWAVLRPEDSPRRLVYSLAATFLGRMCLSGDVQKLSTEQWRIVTEALSLHCEVSGVIRDGFSRRFGQPVLNYHHPKGWQAVLRRHHRQVLAVVHDFEALDIEVPVPWPGDWRIVRTLASGKEASRLENGCLRCFADGPKSAQVILLEEI
jgi:alpha-galactosidase